MDPFGRVRLQAALQRHVDQSISSTVNLPQDTPKEVVEALFLTAWKEGCKGITVFREGSREEVMEPLPPVGADLLPDGMIRYRLHQALPPLPWGAPGPKEGPGESFTSSAPRPGGRGASGPLAGLRQDGPPIPGWRPPRSEAASALPGR
ncbi:hypothetical protein [Thermus sp.]|uniref:hypothetical protein n=1 Tax=Thermus sp. TaxID=275 RepID=UPI00298F3693|nr:hypothetical protein [Thermus sp.]MDW8356664.1 hypothetical protein [Thermus sp.]